MSNNFLFIFTFDNEDVDDNEEGISEVYLIRIVTDEPKRLINYFDGDDEYSEKFYDFISDNEENYGVHDVGFMEDYFVMGYNSYEVEPSDRVTVMSNIRDFFIDEGFEESYIITEGVYTELGYDDETEIANKYLSADDIKTLRALR